MKSGYSYRNSILGILLLLIGLPLVAQQKIELLDAETLHPVQEASIGYQTQEDSVKIYSDSNGIFTLELQNPVEITIHSLGYETYHARLTPNKTILQILLYPKPLTLNEVKISAALLNNSYLEMSGGFNQITRKKIQQEKTVSAAEFLMDVPGVFMQQGTYSTNKLVIRGIGSRSAYGTNRIKAYLDEIPLTSGEGVTSFEDLDPLSLAQVEILKGATSAIYGSGLGGTMRLYSNTPTQEGSHASVNSSFGSFGLYKNTLAASHKSEDSYVNALYSNTKSKGYRQNNKYVRNNVMLKTGTTFKNSNLTFLANYIDINGQIPSSLNKAMFENTPEAAAPNWLAIEGYEKYYKVLGGITIETPLNSELVNYFSVSGNLYNGYELRPFNILDDQSSRFGVRQRLAWKRSRFEITGGFEYFRERYSWQLFESNNARQGELFSDNKETRYSLNTFALGKWDVTQNLKFDAGVSLNYFAYRLEDNFNSTNANQSGSYSGKPIISPRAGLVYSINNQNAIYSTVGHGFSLPSVEESLLPEGNINTDLKPEEGITYEAGIRGIIKKIKLQYDLGAYVTRVSNMLVTKRITEDEFMSINAGKTEHKGIELLLSRKFKIIPNSTLLLTGNYSLSSHHFIDFLDDGIDYSGNNMPGIPMQQGHLGVESWYKQKLFISGRISGTASQYLNDANTKSYKGFNTIDVQAGIRHQTKNGFILSIKAEVENLLNAHFASMILINAPQFGNNAPRYYYPGLPRNFFLTLTISK